MITSNDLSLILGIEQRLNFPAMSLVDCIMFETGGTFSPSIKNKTSGATGLIQFLESTAEGLEKGLYNRLPGMTVGGQLKYVEKYFLQLKKVYPAPPNEAFDVYCLMLHPPLFNKPLDTVFATEGTKRYLWNKGFDVDANGTITKQEIKKRWVTGVDKLKAKANLPIATVTASSFIVITIAVFLAAMYYVLKMPG